MEDEEIRFMDETLSSWIDVAVIGVSNKTAKSGASAAAGSKKKQQTVHNKYPLLFEYEACAERKERDSSVRLLRKAIESRSDASAVAIAIEQSVFEAYYYVNKALYVSKMTALIMDLTRNAETLLSQFEPSILHLLSSETRAIGTDLEKARNQQRAMYDKTLQPSAMDDDFKGLFECPKCHSQKTTHTEKQTRSADEPMTVFIQCLACGARSRQ